ncbi:protein mono-ADP-ribosyltransferase PARP11-like [Girardinichthys multiradiatus]|uniref:protein mono-ADP-ribosyltransferase PARP11-like n=1 Tax=Girardinichthys multiradiatus TaxID=208333 RepID=UPI001FADADED|nr:protein mono-ADP-ribosyltransferase PARP11-like [Girardinichthys multiradiatus]
MWALDEVNMDTTDTPWHWYYLADCGRWHSFEDDTTNPISSEDIEKYYLRDSKSFMNVNTQSYRSQLDFSGMLQTDLTTGKQRRIQRHFNLEKSCSCFCGPPVFWDQLDPTAPYQLIQLNKLTSEYRTVADYVNNDGLLNKSIVAIRRIQNLDLWEIYCRKKKQLMKIKGVKEIPERRLFHGTDTKNVDSICKYNFDLRIRKKNGRTYGNGIYFAIHASHAKTYSTNSTASTHDGDNKIIFLARVIVGKYNLGKPDLFKPDEENSYDSCVNDIDHPKIFIIFDPNQIYPEYLIEYQ